MGGWPPTIKLFSPSLSDDTTKSFPTRDAKGQASSHTAIYFFETTEFSFFFFLSVPSFYFVILHACDRLSWSCTPHRLLLCPLLLFA